MPGKNDCLSVYSEEEKHKVKVQKWLMLGTLKESYEDIKKSFPNDKIGFSIKLNVVRQGQLSTYKDCIALSLFGNLDSSCYLLNCSKCSGTNALKDKLQKILNENGYQDAEIKFNQWVSTDRCDLETFIKPTEDFQSYFIKKIRKLIPHYFESS